MSKEQIKNFIEELKTNSDLQQRHRTEKTANGLSLMEIANAAGYDFTETEWDEYARAEEAKNVKLSDDELEKVSAGGLFGDCPGHYDYVLCVLSLCRNYNKKTGMCLLGNFD